LDVPSTDRRQPVLAELVEPTTPPAPLTLQEVFALLTETIRKDVNWDGSDVMFAEKYRGATRAQLQAAHAVVQEECNRERQAIVDERMKLGLYEVVDPGKPTPEIKSKPGGGPVSFGFAQEAVGQQVISKVTIIPPEEYPAYQALALEWNWLDHQVSAKGGH
jgi:hypothetical protein